MILGSQVKIIKGGVTTPKGFLVKGISSGNIPDCFDFVKLCQVRYENN
jgi:hypothetical protein